MALGRLYLVLLVALIAVGCGSDSAKTPAGSQNPDVEWGLGAKADGGDCSEEAPLCWTTSQSSAMRRIMSAQDELNLGLTDAQQAALKLTDAIAELSAKLTPEESLELNVLQQAAQEFPANANDDARKLFLDKAQKDVLDRVVGSYVAAHVVVVGNSAQLRLNGSADDISNPVEDLPTTGLNDDMRASLEKLGQQGPFGKLYRFLFEHTDVLEREYPVFDEAFPFSEPREERMERIIEHRQLVAARNAAITGAESLIPIAGAVLSFSHGQFLGFKNKMKLAIEMASLYGIDIREGDNLFFVAVTAMEMPSTKHISAASFALKFLAKAAAKKVIGASVKEVTKGLLAKAASQLLQEVSKKGAEMAATAAAQNAAIGAGKQVLGLATFGLTILVSAGAKALKTQVLGHHTATTFRSWGGGFMEEAGVHLRTRAGRECMATTLGSLMQADGDVSAPERALLAAQLEKTWYENGKWLSSQPAEWQDLANLAKAGGDVASCAKSEFRDLPDYDRVAILGNARLMLTVDGNESSAELAVYQDFHDEVNPDGWFSDGLEKDHVDYVHSYLHTLLVAPADAVSPTQQHNVTDLPIDSVLPYLATPRPGPEAAIACAFDSNCN